RHEAPRSLLVNRRHVPKYSVESTRLPANAAMNPMRGLLSGSPKIVFVPTVTSNALALSLHLKMVPKMYVEKTRVLSTGSITTLPPSPVMISFHCEGSLSRRTLPLSCVPQYERS